MLLLAAAQDTAPALEQVLEHREIAEDLVEEVLCARAPGKHADLQVFADGELRENLTSLRNVAKSGTGPYVRRQPGEISAVEQNLAGLRPQQAHDALEQRGLAHAVAAHETDDLPLFHFEVHVAQDERLTVRHL